MLEKVKEALRIGESFDTLVEKELQKQPLAQLYFNMRTSPISLKMKNSFLDGMDKYVQLSHSPKLKKTAEFEELETTLLLDIFHVINGRPYAEWDHLASSVLALEEYKSLSDEKKALFRKGVTEVPHKRKSFSSASKQNTRV